MFTQSVPAPVPAPPSSGLHAASSPSPVSPTRSSRLRGLSYLRSYTQSHLLNREHSNGGSSVNPSVNAADADGAINDVGRIPSPTQPSVSPTRRGRLRSESSPLRPTSSAPAPTGAATASHRFSLVSPLLHPLNTSPTVEVLPAGDLVDDHTASVSGTGAVALVRTSNTDLPAASTLAAAATANTTTTSLSSSSFHMPATADMTRSQSATDASPSAAHMENLPSIRFSTFYDPRSTRPSLKFAPMSRTLPTGKEVIRVGRYSERDSQPNPNPNIPSSAHVGFKSKVVSRRHCEFWFENNRWYIKDVKSSSGTFLNHIRLSQPGTESKPFPINDGDIVQLGIDFKGGEEMIFRCVKMRVELNRGWQNKLNAFNLNTHKRLRNMTKTTDGDGSAQSSQDCSICLNSIAPCQSLFVAPCSHTWHYKCIRSLLESPQYPSFICPNCRAAVDLEADVEDPPEEWDQMEMEDVIENTSGHNDKQTSDTAAVDHPERTPSAPAVPQPLPLLVAEVPSLDDTTMHLLPMQIDTPTPLPPQQQLQPPPQQQQPPPPLPPPPPPQQMQPSEPLVSHATSSPVPIPFPLSSANGAVESAAVRSARTPSPTENHVASHGHGHEGPITPRNDAGPWVFDGSGIRLGSGRVSTDSRLGEMRNLDTAAAEVTGQAPK